MKVSALLGLVFCLALSACAAKATAPSQGNLNEIFIGKPYDLVYLAVFDAVNELSAWVPDKTLQSEGLIRIQNTQYSHFDDSDRRVISIRIRRDGQSETVVFLDPESRNVIGASDVLDAIRKKLGVSA